MHCAGTEVEGVVPVIPFVADLWLAYHIQDVSASQAVHSHGRSVTVVFW